MPETKKYLTARQVKERYGGRSEMWLWRLIQRPDLSFPKPTYIQRNRYWNESELDAWDEKQREVVA